jgi:hypothetical protein
MVDVSQHVIAYCENDAAKPLGALLADLGSPLASP